VRQKFVAGNWKMHTNLRGAEELARGVVAGLGGESRVRVAICPPFPYLLRVADIVKGSPVLLGAQNLYPEKDGAFTGEVSPHMLRDVGCHYVILGHSERRHRLGENDTFINHKVKAALEAGLSIILCVGETLEQRDADRTERVLDTQLTFGLSGVAPQAMTNVVIAYEPVWAIGTGRNATPEQAQKAHAFLRRRAGELLGADVARDLIIQYGGSAKPENVASLLSQPDVDGALIGGASLRADMFLAIIRAALP
jgi:triosephosphate isomerase